MCIHFLFRSASCFFLALSLWNCDSLQCRTRYYPSGKKLATYTAIKKDQQEVPHGLYVTYYESGVRKSLIGYQDGKKSGFQIFWYSNGQIQSRQEFADDQPIGIAQYWDECGNTSNSFASEENELFNVFAAALKSSN